MEVKINKDGQKAVVDIAGRLDTISSAQFESSIHEIVNSDATQVALDCKELSYVSSAGLRLFLTLQKSMKAKGGTLCLRNVCPDIMEVFNVTGFSSILKIE